MAGVFHKMYSFVGYIHLKNFICNAGSMYTRHLLSSSFGIEWCEWNGKTKNQ